MFEIIPLPDSVLHAQCVLQSAAPLPAGATREGALDISSLHFCERPDVEARFALLLNVRSSPVEGLRFEWEDVRDEENDVPRMGEVRLLRVRVRNESNAPLPVNCTLTLAGFALAPRPLPLPPILPLAVLPSWTNTDLHASTLAGVDLRQAWRAVGV